MTDKVQKIREEVEKLHGNPYYMMAVKDVLAIIDSMQKEPVSEDLEDAAYKFVMDNFGNPKEPLYKFDQRCFKAGANWQKEKEYTCYEEAFEDGAKWKKEQIEKVLLSEVLPCFMHGGEADEVVAKLDEVLN